MDRLRLVLVETEGPVNLGMIARLAENFEVDELFLVRPRASIEEARRYAVHAAHRLDTARIVESLEEALEGAALSICTSAKSGGGMLRDPVPPWEAARIASEAPGTVALVMGRESVGLTRREIALCSLLSTIPASPRYPVLNLTNATAIYLYELYRARRPLAGAVERPPARVLRLLEAYALAVSRRLAGDERRASELWLAVRRLAAKSIASRRELENLLYLLSRCCRRLEGCAEEVRSHLQPGPGGRSGEGAGGGARGPDRRGEAVQG